MENGLEKNRQSWLNVAVIFGGLEFCIPVLIVGGILSSNFSLGEVIFILILGLVVIQWIGNAVIGYVGAKAGVSSSQLASFSLGEYQSKLLVSVTILIISLGWWAIQTAVATDALLVLLGQDKSNFGVYVLITAVVGILFALPSIKGFASIKWVDYIAMPSGLLLVIAVIYLSVDNLGLEKITSWNPGSEMKFLAGVNLIIGINVAQWLLAPDYTRMARPIWKDNVLIPLGIVAVGFPLFIVGAIMTIGIGEADIVKVMSNLGFPAWGFVVLWLATWTSQMVNSYTGGIAISSIINSESEKSRQRLTLLFTAVGIVLAFMGIMDYFIQFLYSLALLVPSIAGVIVSHFFFFKNQPSIGKWNIRASIAMIMGLLTGYLTQYQFEFGIPAVQSLFVSMIVYFLICRKHYL